MIGPASWLLAGAPLGWLLAAAMVFVLPRNPARAGVVALFGAAGSAALAAAGILAVQLGDSAISFDLGQWQGIGRAALRLDALSGFFLLITGAVAAFLFIARPGTLPTLRGRVPPAALALLLISLEIVFLADNVFVFLVGWEGLAISFYLNVAAGYRHRPDAQGAAYWTMGMAKGGGAAVLAAFLVMAASAGGFDFETLRAHAEALSGTAADAAFVLAVAGFGVKIAILPLQSWLPRAYPAAPNGAAGFLAAVGLNAGFYGLIRFLSLLPSGPTWWGSSVVLIGAVTALAGILYATAQTNLKALIAYSSIENAGIIATAIGGYLIGRAVHLELLAGLGLVAALFQIAVHSVAKAGLFVVADGVERHAETCDMEKLGGLTRSLPGLSAIFMVCAGTIIGLPPAGGFPSEWLVLEMLMQGFRTGQLLPEVAMALAGTLLALTAAVAGIAFVKAYFATFLGFRRSHGPEVRVGASTLLAGGALALCAVGLGVAAPWFGGWLGVAAHAAGAPNVSANLSSGQLLIEPVFAKFASISPTELAVVIPTFTLLLMLLGAAVGNRRLGVVRTPVWNSGAVAPGPRTQYTATGWSNPTRVVFDTLLRTRRTRRTSGLELAPEGVVYTSKVPAIVDHRLVLPLVRRTMRLAKALQALQSGSLARYLFYILVTLVAVLLLVPSR